METVTIPRFLSPKYVSSHIHARPGDVVADYGAGAGAFLKPLAEKVGTTGRLVCCDIDQAAVERLGRMVRQQGLSQVDVLWCDLETPQSIRIPDESLDIALLVNTLYQCADRETVIEQVHRTVRPGAVVYVVDWADSFSGVGPTAADVVYKDVMVDLFESQCFVLEREYPAGHFHYGLAFRRL